MTMASRVAVEEVKDPHTTGYDAQFPIVPQIQRLIAALSIAASAIIARTARKPPRAQADAPPAIPALPPRKVQALMTPEPCPTCVGERADSAKRGAKAYGTARPAPITTNPIASSAIPPCAVARPMVALPIAISPEPPVIALRSPTLAATADADKASASRAAPNGSSNAPACSDVRPSPSRLWACRLK